MGRKALLLYITDVAEFPGAAENRQNRFIPPEEHLLHLGSLVVLSVPQLRFRFTSLCLLKASFERASTVLYNTLLSSLKKNELSTSASTRNMDGDLQDTV